MKLFSKTKSRSSNQKTFVNLNEWNNPQNLEINASEKNRHKKKIPWQIANP